MYTTYHRNSAIKCERVDLVLTKLAQGIAGFFCLFGFLFPDSKATFASISILALKSLNLGSIQTPLWIQISSLFLI